MEEIWKDIPSYEGMYQVSNLGRVKSLPRRNHPSTSLMNQTNDKDGYKTIQLCKNSKYKHYRVHRLVMLAFVGKSNLMINHKDENPANNILENLEYVTNKENIRYSCACPIIGTRIIDGKKFYFDAIADTKIYGFQTKCVRNVLYGKQKQTKGYIFEYNKINT